MTDQTAPADGPFDVASDATSMDAGEAVTSPAPLFETGTSNGPDTPEAGAGADADHDAGTVTDTDLSTTEPASGDPVVGEETGSDGGDEADEDEDLGPDWEQLAAMDERTPGQVLQELHLASSSRDDYLDALQRKQAEFENFRRRMQGQAAQQRVAGHADVAGRVLEVLDDFDRTLASIAATADDGVVKGVSLVRDKLLAALREVGLERVDDQGAHFDPNRHEAVQQVPGDGLVGDDGQPVVAEVLRPGYVLGERVLRAAMVAVAQ